MKNKKISGKKFKFGNYHKLMNPSTMVYALITDGEDNTYIADNFVTRDVMPDFESWPWTYGTLGTPPF